MFDDHRQVLDECLVEITCSVRGVLQDSHSDRGDTQRAISVYRDIHSSSIDMRKDKELELEVLSADIKNWEGEVTHRLVIILWMLYIRL